MYSVSIPEILGMLAIIATALIVLGFKEKNDLGEKSVLLSQGSV